MKGKITRTIGFYWGYTALLKLSALAMDTNIYIFCSNATAVVAQLVRASDFYLENLGPNPDWILMSFFPMYLLRYLFKDPSLNLLQLY